MADNLNDQLTLQQGIRITAIDKSLAFWDDSDASTEDLIQTASEIERFIMDGKNPPGKTGRKFRFP